MSDWRVTLRNYLKASGPDVITTDEFRSLCYATTAKVSTSGKPAAQRTADKFLKQMLETGELQPIAGKGVFCNTLGLGRKMSRREALGIIATFSNNDVAIFAGPRAVCSDNGPDGPFWMLTSSNRTIVHRGLLGHNVEEPFIDRTKEPSKDELEALAEFQRGYALATNCNRNWLGWVNELPVESESFTRFGEDGIDGEKVNTYVKTASPELALALLPSLASARHLYPTNESVKINRCSGTTLHLDVYNPMSMKSRSAQVDVSHLARVMQSLPSTGEELAFRRRGFDAITAEGSQPLSNALLSIDLMRDNAKSGRLDELDIDIPEVPSDLSPQEMGFDIPNTPMPGPKR